MRRVLVERGPCAAQAEEGDEVSDGRGAGERDCMWFGFSGERRSQPSLRSRRRDRLVGLGHIHLSAGFAQLAGNDIARNFRAHQQDALSFYPPTKRCDDRLRDILFRRNRDLESMFLDCGFRCRTYGSDPQVCKTGRSDALSGYAPKHGFDAIHAGEDQPVIADEILQGGVERFVRGWLSDLDEGNLDDVAAQFAQCQGQPACLLLRARDEYSAAHKRLLC